MYWPEFLFFELIQPLFHFTNCEITTYQNPKILVIHLFLYNALKIKSWMSGLAFVMYLSERLARKGKNCIDFNLRIRTLAHMFCFSNNVWEWEKPLTISNHNPITSGEAVRDWETAMIFVTCTVFFLSWCCWKADYSALGLVATVFKVPHFFYWKEISFGFCIVENTQIQNKIKYLVCKH